MQECQQFFMNFLRMGLNGEEFYFLYWFLSYAIKERGETYSFLSGFMIDLDKGEEKEYGIGKTDFNYQSGQ